METKGRSRAPMGRVWWLTPVISALWETEAEELLEPRRQGLQWAEIVPLYSSLGDRARLCLKTNRQTKTKVTSNKNFNSNVLNNFKNYHFIYKSLAVIQFQDQYNQKFTHIIKDFSVLDLSQNDTLTVLSNLSRLRHHIQTWQHLQEARGYLFLKSLFKTDGVREHFLTVSSDYLSYINGQNWPVLNLFLARSNRNALPGSNHSEWTI